MQFFYADVARALAGALPLDPAEILDHLVMPPDPSLGDIALPCFPLSARMRRAPAAIAAELAGIIVPRGLLAGASAHGPYLNLRLNRQAGAARLIGAILGAPETWGGSVEDGGKTVCVDFCSPNIAKKMHLGHLRSTVIGQSLVRLHQALGYRVVRINFLGDWGTQFGKLVVAYRRWGDPEALKADPISELHRIYVQFHKAAEADPELEGQGREAFRRLEQGDEELRPLWEFIRTKTLESMLRTLALLGVSFDDYRGEAYYEERTKAVVSELRETGLLVESDGAKVVELDGLPPCLILKSDGTTLYNTRDIAAAIDRQECYTPVRSLYVVDTGQNLRFRQVFTVLAKMGRSWAAGLEHVGFGVMRVGGHRLRTRAGGAIFLDDVLQQAIAAARAELEARSPGMEGLEEAARAIGVGAVIFNDLKQQRQKDIDYLPEEAIGFEGETGPYLQYAHARCRNVLRKAGSDESRVLPVEHPVLGAVAEWGLIAALAAFPGAVVAATRRCEPHLVARALLDVARSFSRFYHESPVLQTEPGARAARLALVAATAITLRRGLWMLGMEAPPMRGD